MSTKFLKNWSNRHWDTYFHLGKKKEAEEKKLIQCYPYSETKIMLSFLQKHTKHFHYLPYRYGTEVISR